MSEQKFPPRLFAIRHCISNGERYWTASQSDRLHGRTPDEEYLSLKEHEALLREAIAEYVGCQCGFHYVCDYCKAKAAREKQ